MSVGFNESEKYLKAVCTRTFLSLYSYLNVFRLRKPASELCDLLVVVGDDILIFSDKKCTYGNSNDHQLNWKRWFKKAVLESAKQLWGAENWIKQYPTQIYLDPKCSTKFPIPVFISPKTKFHLILVAHGTLEASVATLGGTGSLIIDTDLKSSDDHTKPFVIGDISNDKTFIHILDDVSFELLLGNLDTITDFVSYITKREKFLRSGFRILAMGEEELLADYLQTISTRGDHDFTYPAANDKVTGVFFQEGSWEAFQSSPQRIRQQEADRVSYFWDELIEQFSEHAINGTQHYVSEGGFHDAERAIRFMAQESRFARRFLSNSFLDALTKTSGDQQLFRVMDPQAGTGIYYVFGALPHHNPEFATYDDYRAYRLELLESYCLVLRLIRPDAQFVVGITMESGSDFSRRAEDLICFDCSSWSDELQKDIEQLQAETGILTRYTRTEYSYKEYPKA